MSESHTATQQWQSFEMRMRRRRAERCALRASVALEAGVLQDAREALDEAQQLSPDDPEVRLLVARLEEAELALSTPAPGHRRSAAGGAAAAAALIASSAAAGWLWAAGWLPGRPQIDRLWASARAVLESPAPPEHELARAPDRPAHLGAERPVSVSAQSIAVPETSQVIEAPDPTPAPPPPAVDPPPAERRASQPPAERPISLPPAERSISSSRVEPNPASAARDSAAPSRDAPPAVTSSVRSDRTAPSSPPSGEVRPREDAGGEGTTRATAATTPPATEPPARAESPERTSGPEPGTGAPQVSRLRDAPASAAALPVQGTPALPETVPPPRPAAPPPADTAGLRTAPPAAVATSGSPAPVDPETVIRGTLSRYEAAYSGLDAAAASAVYPSVDRRALARAFENLESQTVSLAKCDVRVNGASARADCTGSTRWSPKVGSGAQSASRRWQFDLRNRDGEWVIVNATVR